MKKLLFNLCCIFLLCGVCFAQDFEEEYDDDFDDIFFEAQDVEEAVVKETPATTQASSPFRVYGSVSADLGLVGIFENSSFKPGGYLGLESSIYLGIYPNDTFSLHTGITENIKNYPSFSLNSFYFDYFFLKNIFISAGVKGVTWGYTRLFCDTDYYGSGKKGCGPQYTNIMADSSSYIMCQIRYPWSTGTLSFIPMIPVRAVSSGSVGVGSFVYALSLETILLHTSFDFFARTNGNAEDFNPLVGLEVKRSISGFDFYGQTIAKHKDYVTGTAGFYRLWDAFDPNVGFNLEYQCTRKYAASDYWSHLIAFEGGIKRMGPGKNHKIGLKWHHDILQSEGLMEFAYLISGIFPYANWTNACTISYSNVALPVVQVGSAISMDLNF